MNDKDDKTVFIQPGASSFNNDGDRTIIVPNPGNRSSIVPPPMQQPQPPVASASLGASPRDSADFNIQHGLNPLVTSASVLLSVSNRLRSTLDHDNVQALHRQLLEELKQFDLAAKKQSIAPEQVLSARYLLCTMLDEIVLNTPWGASSPWGQHTLLSHLHKDTAGGEKCFTVLQRMLESPAVHLDVLELFYLCISLGFQGKFKLDPRGRENLESISNTLYQTIKNYRGDFEPDLSPNWASQTAQRHSLMQYIPVWVVASCVLLALLVTFSIFRLWLYQATEPVAKHLNNLAQIEQNYSQPTSSSRQ